MEPYESLANAIVMQAVKDYREAIHFLKRHPHTPDLDTEEAMKDKQKRILRERIINNEDERDDIERFFHSGWFEILSNLDGKVLLNKVREMEVG